MVKKKKKKLNKNTTESVIMLVLEEFEDGAVCLKKQSVIEKCMRPQRRKPFSETTKMVTWVEGCA